MKEITAIQNNQTQPDVASSMSTDTLSNIAKSVPPQDVQLSVQKTQSAVKPVVQNLVIPPIKGKLKTKGKSKVLAIGLWVVGAFVFVIIGVLGGKELYRRLHTVQELQTEDVVENVGGEQEEESKEEMTVEEIQRLIDIDAVKDSLREIEDAVVDIVASFAIIDENLEQSDDPPEL